MREKGYREPFVRTQGVVKRGYPLATVHCGWTQGGMQGSPVQATVISREPSKATSGHGVRLRIGCMAQYP